MCALYMGPRLVMIRTIREKMCDILETWDSEAGMHTVGWLPPHVDDSEVSVEDAKAGVYAMPLSSYSIRPRCRGGLVLGYAAFKPNEITKSLGELECVIRQLSSSTVRCRPKSTRRLIA
jgi:GntR family transcriptional regulator/MocR family aminotransferase